MHEDQSKINVFSPGKSVRKAFSQPMFLSAGTLNYLVMII